VAPTVVTGKLVLFTLLLYKTSWLNSSLTTSGVTQPRSQHRDFSASIYRPRDSSHIGVSGIYNEFRGNPETCGTTHHFPPLHINILLDLKFSRWWRLKSWWVNMEAARSFFRNVGILPQQYTASRPRRPRLESSSPWKPPISMFNLLHLFGVLQSLDSDIF